MEWKLTIVMNDYASVFILYYICVFWQTSQIQDIFRTILHHIDLGCYSMKRRKTTLGERLVSVNDPNKYQITINLSGNFL